MLLLRVKLYDLLQISLVTSYKKRMGSLKGVIVPRPRGVGSIKEKSEVRVGEEPEGIATVLNKYFLEDICWVLCQKVGTQQ